MRTKLIAAIVVLAALAAGGWFAYTRFTRPAATDIAANVEEGPLTIASLLDSRAEVRRKALEEFGHSRDKCLDEELLPLLHDAEADIRTRSEALLRERGLTDKEIELGRVVSDPSPLKRLQVIDRLPADADLDPEVWLQRLTQDPSPAVRIGAARAAMDPTSPLGVNLTERVREMAQKDPDGTVRQIAEFLIRSRTAQ
jgi:hypothetical protein